MLCSCPVPSTPPFRSSCGTLKQSASLGDTVLINRKQLIIIIVGLRIIRGCRAQPHTHPPNTHRAPEGKVTPCQDGKFLSRFVINPHYITLPLARFSRDTRQGVCHRHSSSSWNCVQDGRPQFCPHHPDPVAPSSSGVGGRWELDTKCPGAHRHSSFHGPPTPG